MRKTVSIFLLLIFFFQSVGCLLIFKLQQFQVRQHVKHHILSNLSDNELILIKLPANKRQEGTFPYHFWDSDEFSYAGKMYDVVRQENHKNTIWYYCFPDEKETNILANLDTFVNNQMAHNPTKKKQREDAQRLFSTLFPVDKPPYFILNESFSLLHIFYSFHIKTWTSLPLTPPPQFS